jgi:6-phosphogluconolactonase (cycloisomerase 2 family)
MTLTITNTDNVSEGDDAALELLGAAGVTSAVVAGITYLFVAGQNDGGVSVFSVSADGTLTNADNIDGIAELGFPTGVATAAVGGNAYLFVAAAEANVLSVDANGTLTHVDSALAGGPGVTTAVIGGITYLFATHNGGDGVSVFSVAAAGTLTFVGNTPDDATLEIGDARDVATAVIGGATYLFVTGFFDDGFSVFAVDQDGTMLNVGNVVDFGPRELNGATGVTTAVVAGTTYLFVAAEDDDAVNVFAVAADGTPSLVESISDTPALALDGARDVAAAVLAGTTYLFVTAGVDNGVSVFSVAADGTLTHVTNIIDDPALQLGGAHGIETAVVGGTTYLFVAGNGDSGVSVFSLVDEIVPPLGDVLWQHSNGVVATAGHEFPAVPANFEVAGTGDFDGDGDADILWRQDQGLVVTWEMENGDLLTTHSFGEVSTNFQIVGTGDFDGDGDADILWRHRDGLNVIWEMEDGAFVVNRNLPQASTSFEVAGTGDFDLDGDADILWRGNQGQVVTWEIEDGAFVVNHNLPQVPTSFQIAGTGDFDGDGDADILWRGNDGQVVTWEMEGGAFVVNHNLPVVPTNFAIAGTGDFDSDGDSDILWRHTDGLTVTWEMEGGELLQTHNFGVVAPGLQIRGTGEFDLV